MKARIPPAVLQVELHPYLTQESLVAFCKSKNIVLTAYSPLGGPARPSEWAKSNDAVLLEDPKLKALADKYSATPAQILIRFAIDRGMSVVPKSVTPSRIESNMNVWRFEISEKDMELLMGLNRNWRACFPLTKLRDGTKEPCGIKHKDYPFDAAEQGFGA